MDAAFLHAQGLATALAEETKVIAFDVDGTLTDSIGQIVMCFQRTFDYCHLPVPSAEAVCATIGMTLHLGIQSLLPDPQDEHLAAEVTQLYRDTFSVSKDINETKLFPGVQDLLCTLHDRGYTLAIASGKSRLGVQRVFVDFPELEPLFSAIVTGDQCASKPDPSMVQIIAARTHVTVQEIMGVGDALLDIRMFHNAHCLDLGVLTGVCKEEDFIAEKTSFILPKVTDLMHFL